MESDTVTFKDEEIKEKMLLIKEKIQNNLDELYNGEVDEYVPLFFYLNNLPSDETSLFSCVEISEEATFLINLVKKASPSEKSEFVTHFIDYLRTQKAVEKQINSDVAFVAFELCKLDCENIKELTYTINETSYLFDLRAYRDIFHVNWRNKECLITYFAEACGERKKEAFQWLLRGYFNTLEKNNNTIDKSHIIDIKNICKKMGYIDILCDIMHRKTEVFSRSAIDYVISKDDDGKYLFDDFDDDDVKLSFLMDLLYQMKGLIRKQKTLTPYDVELIDKYIEVADLLKSEELKELIVEIILDKTKPKTNIIIGESNHLLNDIFVHRLPDKEFCDLMTTFKEEFIYENIYEEMVDYYIRSFYIAYNNNPDLAKLSLKILNNNLKNSKISGNFLCDIDTYSRTHFLLFDYRSFYNSEDKKIVMDGELMTPRTCLHETGHLLHDCLDNLGLPSVGDFDEIIKNAKKCLENNDSIYKFDRDEGIYKLMEMYNKIQQEVYVAIERILEEDESLKTVCEKLETILERLEIRPKYKEYVQKNCLENSDVLEDQKGIIAMQLSDLYMDINYPWLGPISDIMDAICDGNVSKMGLPGHGEDYYKEEINKFQEIFTNYYTISMLCPDRIEMLRETFGEEFVDYMENYMEYLKTKVDSNENKTLKLNK